MDRALAYVREHRTEALNDLRRLVRQPSVSTRSIGIDECASLTEALMRSAGLRTDRFSAPGAHPVLFGERDGGPKRLLFYNHYDVQPPDPIEEWHHEPFSAVVDDGRLWGRGAGDMKGALVGRLWAIRSWLEAEGTLPVTVRFLVEGEEETGSRHLDEILAAHAGRIAADACVWESGSLTDGRAEIVCGCKGVLVVEMVCREGRIDLHSAAAATLPSAVWRLVHALASLYDPETGLCVMDGYMEAARPPTESDLALCAAAATPERLKEHLEASGREEWHPSLRDGMEVEAASSFRPTCNIQGISAGYAGAGMKNVLPHQAIAKLDFRLVADQSPQVVLEQLRRHLDRRGDGSIELHPLAMVEPSRSSVEDPLVVAMIRAAKETYGGDPIVSPVMGGFGPMHAVSGRLGVATVLGGDYQRPGGNIHAPNEHLWIDDFMKGIEATIRLLRAYAEE